MKNLLFLLLLMNSSSYSQSIERISISNTNKLPIEINVAGEMGRAIYVDTVKIYHSLPTNTLEVNIHFGGCTLTNDIRNFYKTIYLDSIHISSDLIIYLIWDTATSIQCSNTAKHITDSFFISHKDMVSSIYEYEREGEQIVDIFPIPTDRFLNFRCLNHNYIDKIELYNMTGKKITNLPNTEKKLDLITIQKGIYFIRIYDTNGRLISHKKIVKL